MDTELTTLLLQSKLSDSFFKVTENYVCIDYIVLPKDLFICAMLASLVQSSVIAMAVSNRLEDFCSEHNIKYEAKVTNSFNLLHITQYSNLLDEVITLTTKKVKELFDPDLIAYHQDDEILTMLSFLEEHNCTQDCFREGVNSAEFMVNI